MIGWQLLPIDPTQEMVREAYAKQPAAINVGFAQSYRDMVGAAPAAPRTPDDDLSRAIASIPQHLYWLIGKGRTRPKEPLYAVQLIDPESGIAIVETEAEQLADAINAAVKKLNGPRQQEGSR